MRKYFRYSICFRLLGLIELASMLGNVVFRKELSGVLSYISSAKISKKAKFSKILLQIYAFCQYSIIIKA